MATLISVPRVLSPPEALAAGWLACPLATQGNWLATHQAALTLPLLEQLKAQSDQALRHDTQLTARITEGMLRIAAAMPTEPLAFPLAWWARGNHFSFSNPHEAVSYYERALLAYQQAGKSAAVLTIISNLLYVQCEIDLTAAEQLYATALREWQQATTADPGTMRRIAQNGGIVLRRLGRYEEALTAHKQALTLANQLGQVARIPEILGNIALTLGDLGRFQECEVYILESHAAALVANNRLTAARMEMNLGELYTILGRPADALQTFARAHRQFTALNNSMELASVALREAHLFERIGVLGQATRRYRLAKTHFEALQMWPQVWQATVEGARARRRLGDYQQAAHLLTEASALLKQHGHLRWRSEWQLEASALALAQRDWPEAQQLLLAWQHETGSIQTPWLQARHDLLWGELWEQRAESTSITQSNAHRAAEEAYQHVLTFADEQGELRLKRQALVGLGRLRRTVDPQQARAQLLAAATQDDLMRSALSVQELKAAFLHQSSDVLEQLFVWATSDSNTADALLQSWRAKGSALIELLTAHQESPATPSRRGAMSDMAVDPITQQIDDLRHRLTILQWRANQETQSRPPQTDTAAEPPEISRLEQQIIDLRLQRNQQRTTVSVPHQTIQTIAATMTTAMTADLLIEFMQAQGQLYATLLDQDGTTTVVELGDVNDLLDLLDELTLHFRSILTLPPTQHNRALLHAECRALLAQGYEHLIRPLPIPTKTTSLLIAPCAPLHRMPFAALWDGTTYLTERYQIELTPTSALLALPPPAAPVTQPLVITDSAAGRLPVNRQQATAIQRHFPASVCLCDDPNALHYLQNLAVAPQFLHIAAHTVEREDTPIFTALQLTNSMLTVEQSYELPLYGTNLVTLSSCITNSGMDSAGAILAFQSAFFAAGAQRVLSTLWEIQSEVTEQWMALFYQHLQSGLLPPVALRHTQLAFIQQTDVSHPVFWAAFACSRR